MENITVLGLGYIGLPTATLLAKKGFKVNGIDINPVVVDNINEGKIHIKEDGLEDLTMKAVKTGNLKAFTQVQPSDIYLIVVPTPFKGKNEPDISYVEQAIITIIPLLKEEDLIIIESTSPVGTTELMANMIYHERPDLANQIHIAYCPERVLPGNIMYELVHNDRVIGGINSKSSDKAVRFYSRFVSGKLHVSDAKTAEMCKLVENSSRDVQIAFANELSIICDKAGIDIWNLIDLANKHPRVNILQPGSGVGGHCIAVDPYFIVSGFPLESQLISKGREINNYKTFWVTEKIITNFKELEKSLGRQPKIAIMGLAFKPNIDDLRESPSEYIASKLIEQLGEENCLVVEPNLKSHSNYKLVEISEALNKADIVTFLVAHNEFKELSLPVGTLVLDYCGVQRKFNT